MCVVGEGSAAFRDGELSGYRPDSRVCGPALARPHRCFVVGPEMSADARCLTIAPMRT